MTVLFTKKVDGKVVSEQFGNHFSYDFVDVIAIRHLDVAPFDLRGRALIFTSVNGVRSFFKNGFQINEDFTCPGYNRVFAVGPKTKQELRKYGHGTFKVLRHASELSTFIIAHYPKERFLHFCGNLALDVLDRNLPLQNISYRKITVYNTDLLYPQVTRPYDAVVFFSPSGVRSFLKKNEIRGKQLFSIGYTTEKELAKYTDQQIHTSKESHLADLLHVIISNLKTDSEIQ